MRRSKELKMRIEVSIDIWSGPTLLKVNLDYRPWTPDPDPWELEVPGIAGVVSSGDWLSDRRSREARFSADILDILTGTTSHDVVLRLHQRFAHLPGTNPFFFGQTGSGKTGAVSSIHSSIAPGAVVSWRVVKGPPPPV
jgi:hypothetical protein